MIKKLCSSNLKVRTCAIALLLGAGVGLWMPQTNADTTVRHDIDAPQPASSPAINPDTTVPHDINAPQPASSPAINPDTTTVPQDAPEGFFGWLFSFL